LYARSSVTVPLDLDPIEGCREEGKRVLSQKREATAQDVDILLPAGIGQNRLHH
jgi:hypothetical protein